MGVKLKIFIGYSLTELEKGVNDFLKDKQLVASDFEIIPSYHHSKECFAYCINLFYMELLAPVIMEEGVLPV